MAESIDIKINIIVEDAGGENSIASGIGTVGT